MCKRTWQELETEVDRLLGATDQQIADWYECDIKDAYDMRENHIQNLEAERVAAGYPQFTFHRG